MSIAMATRGIISGIGNGPSIPGETVYILEMGTVVSEKELFFNVDVVEPSVSFALDDLNTTASIVEDDFSIQIGDHVTEADI